MNLNGIKDKVKTLYYNKNTDYYLIILIIISVILKFVGLGYSDFQGDEIKALFIVPADTSVWDFLLTQRKGPMQFLITYALKFIDPTYTNQFLIRLPFAIAGFLAVIYFYKLMKLHFNSRTAFYASFLLATNGFFVAFGRIAQYQSFVILFSILCLYFISLSTVNKKYALSGVIWGFICWALSILSHYDGGFILPVVIGLMIMWLKKAELTTKSKIFTLIAALGVSGAMLAVFYIPFVVNLSKSTVAYWQGRLEGDVSAKLSSSKYLFTVYQPIYVIHFYLASIGLFFLFLAAAVIRPIAQKILKFRAFTRKVGSGLSYFVEDFFKRYPAVKLTVVLIWFTIGYIFWEEFVYIPGTHIYTYLLPAFILIGIALDYISYIWDRFSLTIKKQWLFALRNSIFFLVFSFIFLQSYTIFVDHTTEYPWQPEKFLIWTMFRPTASYHLSMFGFPYNRDWEGIAKFVKSHPEVTGYSTNERISISRYYINQEKDSNKAGYYIYIRYPQSLTDGILSEKAMYWANKHAPVYTLSKNGEDLVSIYEMPVGGLEKIRAEGY
jgi:hypothetical protein